MKTNNKNRRDFLKTAAAGALSAGLFPGLALGKPGGLTEKMIMKNSKNSVRPNVLHILVDQLRYDAFSCAGNPVVKTPNIDRLAREGSVFTDAVCTAPLCGPSRAALLTGCYASSRAYTSSNREPDEQGVWQRELVTVDEALHRDGYNAAYLGKWHVGQGHRECYGNECDIFGHDIRAYGDYIRQRSIPPTTGGKVKTDRYTGLPYRAMPVDDMMAEAAGKGFPMPHHNEAGILDVPDNDTLTAWTVRKTIDFLKKGPAQPFAVTCSVLQPHAPLLPNEKYGTMFDPDAMPLPPNVDVSVDTRAPIPGAMPTGPQGLGQYTALYYGLVKELDDWVGKLLDELDIQGLADNTLVVFTADHGELLGSHRTLSKGKFYEECLRVPLFVRLPGIIKSGLSTSAPCTGADIMPTILDYCGVPVPAGVQGISLRGALEGKPPAREYAYSELGKRQCLRSERWKYIKGEKTGTEIYDLKNDPYETVNVYRKEGVSTELKELKTGWDALLDRQVRMVVH